MPRRKPAEVPPEPGAPLASRGTIALGAVVRALFASGQVDSAEVIWERIQERWPEYVEEQRRLHGAR